jgi:hypothetical protein
MPSRKAQVSHPSQEKLGVYLVRAGVAAGIVASTVVTIPAGHGFLPFLVGYATWFAWLGMSPIPPLAYLFMGADVALVLIVRLMLSQRMWSGAKQQLIVLGAFIVAIVIIWVCGWHACEPRELPVYWFTSIPLAICITYCVTIAVFLVLRKHRKHAGQVMSCLSCGYPLRGLSSNRCPECGATFR